MTEYIIDERSITWPRQHKKDSLYTEVVRCRDCKQYRPELYKHISCELLARYVESDGFCAWGERG